MRHRVVRREIGSLELRYWYILTDVLLASPVAAPILSVRQEREPIG